MTTDEDQQRSPAQVLRRSIAEIALGITLGGLILWVLVVSVNDIEFIYQGF